MYERGTKVIARGSAGEVDSVYSNVNGVYYEVVFRVSENEEYSRSDTRGWFKESEVKAVSKVAEAYFNSPYITEKVCIQEALDLFDLYRDDNHEIISTWSDEKGEEFVLKVADAMFSENIMDSDYLRYIFEDVLRDCLAEELDND